MAAPGRRVEVPVIAHSPGDSQGDGQGDGPWCGTLLVLSLVPPRPVPEGSAVRSEYATHFGWTPREMARRERQGEQSCYISAPAGLDAGGLRRALKDLSVRIVQEGETLAPGESLIVTLREALQSADFVCGVVGVGETSPNVLFELGLAAGLARPVFVVRPGFGSMPLALEGWLPEAPPDLGNPLLIELVGASRPPRGAAEQARRYLEIARVRCALVISEASALDPPVEMNGGYIFRLTIAEFLDALERNSLVQRLIDQRNRLVHGVR